MANCVFLSFPGRTWERYSEAPASLASVPTQVYHPFNKMVLVVGWVSARNPTIQMLL